MIFWWEVWQKIVETLVERQFTVLGEITYCIIFVTLIPMERGPQEFQNKNLIV